jgi:hypothetical protein
MIYEGLNRDTYNSRNAGQAQEAANQIPKDIYTFEWISYDAGE